MARKQKLDVNKLVFSYAKNVKKTLRADTKKWKTLRGDLLFILILSVTLSAFYFIQAHLVLAKERALVVEQIKEASQRAAFFKDMNLQAKAVYVFDITEQKEIFMLRADDPLPLASITKVMTALIALDTAGRDAMVTISDASLKAEGNSGLLINEKWKLANLLKLTLVSSSNDGAEAVAQSVQVENRNFTYIMNKKARELGLSQTHFENSTGLDLDQAYAGAHGSARDMAYLLAYSYQKYPDIFRVTASSAITVASAYNFNHTVKNTNTFTSDIRNLRASKTGFTDLAGGNLVIITEPSPGHLVAIAVLGSTYDGRFQDIKILAERAEKYILRLL
ncbi:MAG: serine hydrolase [Candidatus Paceibacterota bacterium]|jgi:D-alanyl-D-alanine carboxypeptidase